MKTQDLKTQDTRKDSGYALTPRTEILVAARKALEKNRQLLTVTIIEAERLMLPYKLCLGLHCLKAYMVFVFPEDQNSRGGRKSNNRVTRDTVSSPEGFEGWAAREIPWLKRPVAYKYINAIKGLGLDENATEDDVHEALSNQLAIGPCTLKMLCDAAAELVRPQLPPPTPDHQLEFNFLRENLHDFAVQSGNILAIADRLKTIPSMHKAACARVYGMLRDLTGTDWQPSDTPDALCEIDPDTIDL